MVDARFLPVFAPCFGQSRPTPFSGNLETLPSGNRRKSYAVNCHRWSRQVQNTPQKRTRLNTPKNAWVVQVWFPEYQKTHLMSVTYPQGRKTIPNHLWKLTGRCDDVCRLIDQWHRPLILEALGWRLGSKPLSLYKPISPWIQTRCLHLEKVNEKYSHQMTPWLVLVGVL